MKNRELERYNCQMVLPNFGEKKQQLLENARILIVGMGGLGCPTAQYLTAAGIGEIGMVDDDIIDFSNLHRQILFSPEDVKLKKVAVACRKLQQQNPSIKIKPFDLRITSENVLEIISQFDLVIEGTDNFETKYLLNDACVLNGIPLIYGAVYQYEGQMSIFNIENKDGSRSPNYRDLFPDAETALVPDCSEGGVMPTLTGIIGTMQANEAIKYFLKDENLMSGKLWMINTQSGMSRSIHIGRVSHTEITHLPESIPTINPVELFESSSKNLYTLLDVRSKEEHQEFNIGGSDIPIEQLESQLNTIQYTKPIVCYCRTEKRSVVAAKMIRKYKPGIKIFVLKGGIKSVAR